MGYRDFLKNKTRLEKQLILFVVLLCGVSLALLIGLLSSDHDPEICDNPECVRAATHILDTVDPSVDPCVDFYQFACGTFLKKAFSLGQPSTLHHLGVITNNKLKEIVVENVDSRNRSKALQMQRKFYRTCINDALLEADGDQTFMKLLDDITGGWPIVKGAAWDEASFNWTNAMIKARKSGFFYQFFFRVSVFNANDSTNMIWIKPPYEKDVDSFHWKFENEEVMKQIAKYLGARSVDTSWEIGLTSHFAKELQLNIQKYINSTSTNASSMGKKIVLKNLEHNRIKLNWSVFLKEITGVEISENDVVFFDVDDYFRDLYHLLLRTPKRVRANYMAWGLISTNIHYLSPGVRRSFKNIQKSVNDSESDLTRPELCFKLSREFFPRIAEGEYVRRYTPPSKRAAIRDMIKNIKSELRLVLQQTPWMDEATKSKAVSLLQNITEEIGWTKLVYDVREFEKFFGYHQLNITSKKLVDIVRFMTVNGVNRYYSQLRQTGQEEVEEYIQTPKLDVNAFYFKYFQKLMLPAPILQELIFDERRPHYMNYGALGSIIGHEFMHGFIEPANETWWTNETLKNYKTASQCIIDEYKSYSNSGGLQANETVFEENLADFSGVNLAYTAYRKWKNRQSSLQKLPGIKYTPNQLFWIMTGTYLCQEPKLSEVDASRKRTQIYATPTYRVIGRLQNSPYFADDFNCRVGSPMNPEKKCRVFA